MNDASGPVPGVDPTIDASRAPGSPRRVTRRVSIPLHVLVDDPRPAAEQRLGASPRPPVLIGLHGYAMKAESLLSILRRFVPEGFLTLALDGPQTTLVPGLEADPEKRHGRHWGVAKDPEENRDCHRQSVAHALQVAEECGADLDRVALCGFSQPCSFNYRLALDPPHGRPFRSVIGICGGVPGEWSDEAPLSGEQNASIGTSRPIPTSVLHVSTREDPFYPLERIAHFERRLAARFESVIHRLHDGPHRVPSAAFPEMRELLARGAASRPGSSR